MSQDEILISWKTPPAYARLVFTTDEVVKDDNPAPVKPNNPEHQPPVGGITGWICPRCGGGNSPYSSHCPCVPVGVGPVTC